MLFLINVLFCVTTVLANHVFEEQGNKRDLEKKGLKVHYPIGNNSFVVSGLKGNQTRKHHKKFIFNSAGYQKLLLVAAVLPAHQIVTEIQRKLKVKSFVHNHHLLQSDDGVFVIRITKDHLLNDTIYWFVMHPAVLWVDFHRRHHPNNEHALKLAVANVPHQYYSRNQVITVTDTGLDYRHNYFHSDEEPLKMTYNTLNLDDLLQKKYNPKSKVRAYVSVSYSDGVETYSTDFSDEPNGHGTHVTGSCCGDGSRNNQSSIESHSKIVFMDFGVAGKEFLIMPPLITPLLKLSKSLGSNLMSCSWGSATCMYTFTAMEMDRFMYFNREYLIAVSAGNSGPEPYTIGSPASFKNGITVGASQNTRESFLSSTNRFWEDRKTDWVDHERVRYENYGEENLADFSSRGPACDGRIKPTVVYPGQFILSSRAGFEPYCLLENEGTSMSCPGLARLLGMTREILQDRYSIPNPTGALIKNIIITSAKWLTGTAQRLTLTIDKKLRTTTTKTSLDIFDQGFGRAQLEPLMNSELEFMDRIPIASFQRWTKYYISDKTFVFDIGLVWTDFPGYMYASKALVNDLNLILRVINNTGHVRVLYGNQGPVLDDLNVEEKISHRIYAGEHVYVTVQTNGALVSIGRSEEEFTLVWEKGLTELFNVTEDETTLKYLPPVTCENPSQMMINNTCVSSCDLGNLQGVLIDGHCTCVNHQPCGLEPDGTIHISECHDGQYQPCKASKPRIIHMSKHQNIHQLLALTTNGPQLELGVFLAMAFILTAIMFIAFFVIC